VMRTRGPGSRHGGGMVWDPLPGCRRRRGPAAVGWLGFAPDLARTGPAAVVTGVEAEQHPATVRIVTAQSAFAETAIQGAIFGDAVVGTDDRTRVITALELGALAADRTCAAKGDVLFLDHVRVGRTKTREEHKRSDDPAEDTPARRAMCAPSCQVVKDRWFHGVKSSLARCEVRVSLLLPRRWLRFWRGLCG
jgi:hypothetical protein